MLPLLVGLMHMAVYDMRRRPHGRARLYNVASNASHVEVKWGTVMELTVQPAAAKIWLPQHF